MDYLIIIIINTNIYMEVTSRQCSQKYLLRRVTHANMVIIYRHSDFDDGARGGKPGPDIMMRRRALQRQNNTRKLAEKIKRLFQRMKSPYNARYTKYRYLLIPHSANIVDAAAPARHRAG
jgi:hypothetical protein